MPPDLPNEQELVLKKRARRRLVGAIALVLLMIIILPRVLEDRAALAPQEAIKITMPIVPNSQEVVALNEEVVEPKLESNPSETIPDSPQAAATVDAMPSEYSKDLFSTAKQESSNDSSASKSATATNSVDKAKSVEKVQEKAVVKNEAVKAVEKKTSEVKVSEPKPESVPKLADEAVSKKNPASFTVQVGVYSDANNVKYLQGKIKEMGINSRTEKVSTPKGEKIRLKAGSFSSRPDAVKAQVKLQKIGLSGMVVSND